MPYVSVNGVPFWLTPMERMETAKGDEMAWVDQYDVKDPAGEPKKVWITEGETETRYTAPQVPWTLKGSGQTLIPSETKNTEEEIPNTHRAKDIKNLSDEALVYETTAIYKQFPYEEVRDEILRRMQR